MALEVEVQIEGHPHIFLMEIESVLELPKVGEEATCARCNFKGKLSRVGIPGRKDRQDESDSSFSEKQSSLLRKGKS